MSLVWAIAALAVVVMGFAIQRGGTCTVAAVDEVLSLRRATKLAAMLEASLWVAGGLALAQLLHLAGSMPAGVGVSVWTFAGAALLGLGAWVNRACVFGAIARIGSGEWAYAATPLGFLAGCATLPWLVPSQVPLASNMASPLFALAGWLTPLFLAYVLWRVAPRVIGLRHSGGTQRLREAVWAPRAATIVIGVTFVITLLFAGRWAYTDVLADLASQRPGVMLAGPIVLLAALYAGALLGGWSAGRWVHRGPTPGALLRCFVGGVLMAWGSLLIPGSNDGLILIGLPLLWPHAWLAFATMCGTIALALTLARPKA